MPRRVLLTGITGNLGAAMAIRLLRAGDEVYALVRSRRRGTGPRRARESLALLPEAAGLDAAAWARLHIVDADMTDTGGMEALRLPAPVDETWHFASSLKYMPRDRDEIHRANLTGMRNTLALHRRHAAHGARCHYVSTAYLAGRGVTRVPEARIPYDDELAFNNEYERSKLLAENEFLDAVQAGSLDGLVFRPAIVCADPEGCRLVNYNGFYLGLKAWFSLSEYMVSQGRRGDTVRLWVDPDNTLNLVPLGPTVEAMRAIAAGNPAGGEVFNLVNETPPTLAQVFEWVNRHIDVVCVLCGVGDPRDQSRTTYEKLVAYSLTYVSPYVKQRITFDSGNTRRALAHPLAIELYPHALDRLIGSFRRRAALADTPD